MILLDGHVFADTLDEMCLAFASSVAQKELEVMRNYCFATSDECQLELFFQTVPWPQTFKNNFKALQKDDPF